MNVKVVFLGIVSKEQLHASNAAILLIVLHATQLLHLAIYAYTGIILLHMFALNVEMDVQSAKTQVYV